MSKTAALSIRIPASTKAQIEALAKRNHRSVTGEVSALIERYIAANPVPAGKASSKEDKA